MTIRISQQATALVLAVMVTVSVLAGLDVLAASEVGSVPAQTVADGVSSGTQPQPVPGA